MHKYLVRVSKIILAIAALNLFAFSVRHVSQGGKRLGPLTGPFLQFVEFPLTVKEVFEEVNALPPAHIIAEADFQPVNRLDRDLFALNAHAEKDRFIYTLRNLRNDSIHLSWIFPLEEFTGPSHAFPKVLPLNPILLSDSSLLGMLYGKNLFRLNPDSRVMWKNTTHRLHHSLNLDHEGYVWACAWEYAYTQHLPDDIQTGFRDDLILKVDIETGEVVYKKSISQILIENEYQGLLHGYSTDYGILGQEPFHLNDVQPIDSTGPYWEKGDLLLSLRNISAILLYRPSTGKVLRLISGPFLAQHDADIYSDHEISILNNNRVPGFNLLEPEKATLPTKPLLTVQSSNVLIYDLETSTWRYPARETFERENIYTGWQGLHQFLDNGDLFVESTEEGKLFILRGEEVIFRQYANPVKEGGLTEYPHWVRIYESLDFLN